MAAILDLFYVVSFIVILVMYDNYYDLVYNNSRILIYLVLEVYNLTVMLFN